MSQLLKKACETLLLNSIRFNRCSLEFIFCLPPDPTMHYTHLVTVKIIINFLATLFFEGIYVDRVLLIYMYLFIFLQLNSSAERLHSSWQSVQNQFPITWITATHLICTLCWVINQVHRMTDNRPIATKLHQR